MNVNEFECSTDIRISYPFPENEEMWAFWAAHDCSDYTLIVTIYVTEELLAK